MKKFEKLGVLAFLGLALPFGAASCSDDDPDYCNKITAYLIGIVARAAGAGVTTATGTYPINVTLPISTVMSISRRQEVTTLTASALGCSVSGKQNGTVYVVTKTWNRDHTGGNGGCIIRQANRRFIGKQTEN